MMNSAPGSDWQKSVFDNYVRLAQTPQAMENLARILTGKIKLKGFSLDQDRRWNVIILLTSSNYPQAEIFLDMERDKDKSERAVQSSLAATASWPTLENKKKWLNKINSADFSFARTRSILWHFLPLSQTDLRASLSDQFYQDLVSYSKSRDSQFLATYTWALMPTVCTNQSSQRLEKFIEKESAQLPPLVVKALKTGWEEDVRCTRIRAQARNRD
jgi:aminopeptidase N